MKKNNLVLNSRYNSLAALVFHQALNTRAMRFETATHLPQTEPLRKNGFYLLEQPKQMEKHRILGRFDFHNIRV